MATLWDFDEAQLPQLTTLSDDGNGDGENEELHSMFGESPVDDTMPNINTELLVRNWNNHTFVLTGPNGFTSDEHKEIIRRRDDRETALTGTHGSLLFNNPLESLAELNKDFINQFYQRAGDACGENSTETYCEKYIVLSDGRTPLIKWSSNRNTQLGSGTIRRGTQDNRMNEDVAAVTFQLSSPKTSDFPLLVCIKKSNQPVNSTAEKQSRKRKVKNGDADEHGDNDAEKHDNTKVAKTKPNSSSSSNMPTCMENLDEAQRMELNAMMAETTLNIKAKFQLTDVEVKEAIIHYFYQNSSNDGVDEVTHRLSTMMSNEGETKDELPWLLVPRKKILSIESLRGADTNRRDDENGMGGGGGGGGGSCASPTASIASTVLAAPSTAPMVVDATFNDFFTKGQNYIGMLNQIAQGKALPLPQYELDCVPGGLPRSGYVVFNGITKKAQGKPFLTTKKQFKQFLAYLCFKNIDLDDNEKSQPTKINEKKQLKEWDVTHNFVSELQEYVAQTLRFDTGNIVYAFDVSIGLPSSCTVTIMHETATFDNFKMCFTKKKQFKQYAAYLWLKEYKN